MFCIAFCLGSFCSFFVALQLASDCADKQQKHHSVLPIQSNSSTLWNFLDRILPFSIVFDHIPGKEKQTTQLILLPHANRQISLFDVETNRQNSSPKIWSGVKRKISKYLAQQHWNLPGDVPIKWSRWKPHNTTQSIWTIWIILTVGKTGWRRRNHWNCRIQVTIWCKYCHLPSHLLSDILDRHNEMNPKLEQQGDADIQTVI